MDLHGRIDILVNNAAVRSTPSIIPLHDLSESSWDDVMDTNLKGAFFCTRYAIPIMRQQGGGAIFNIASYTAEQAVAGMGAYSISKAALVQLSRAVAVEYGEDNIRANAIILGRTSTGQAKRSASAWRSYWEARGQAPPPVPPGLEQDQIDPVRVAWALVALCHDAAGVIGGASIALDLGVSAGLYTSKYTHQMIGATDSDGKANY
jgi:NAD(P)-dependent dehydrogenase (short-subunit alcohol dehydrogenase family)